MTKIAHHVGVDVDQGTLPAANATLGVPSQTHRLFYHTSLPTSFDADGTGTGVTLIVSYKYVNTNVLSYVRSVPSDRRVILIFHHEPENDYSSGGAFVTEFVSQSKLIRSAGNSSVKVAMCAEGYEYRSGGPAVGGSFIPPADSVDIYTGDMYQYDWNWPSQGLANHPDFQNWHKLVAGRGKQWAITEYGIGSNPTPVKWPVTPAIRDARLQLDHQYLESFGGRINHFCYWWESRAGDIQSKFTDAATIGTWQGIATGT